jgi:plastocyanin
VAEPRTSRAPKRRYAGGSLAAALARHVVCRALAAGLLVTGAAAPGVASVAPTSRTVTIENMRFSPETLTVKRGDRVVWVNKDLFPHTATAQGVFDSKSIAPKASWTHVADKAGRYGYVCTLHPTMKATLVVE